jgi:hypothetical protein
MSVANLEFGVLEKIQDYGTSLAAAPVVLKNI